MIKAFLASGLLILGLASAAPAATLDFNETGIIDLQGSTVVTLSNAVLTSLDANFFIGFGYGETNGNGIACGATIGGDCEADWRIDFATDIMGLTFASFGTDPGDLVDVMAYLNGALLGSIAVTTDMMLDFSGFGVIDRLVFDDSSSGAGIGFGDFSFDTADMALVPLPATLPLLLAGVFGLSVARRRGRRAA